MPVFNVVVFGSDAELKEITALCDVIRIENVFETIEKYPDLNIDDEMVKSINDILRERFIVNDDAMKNHLDYVSTLFNPSGNDQESSSPRSSSNVDVSGSEEKSGADGLKSISIKKMIKIALIIAAILFAIKEPWIVMFIILLLIPNKKGRRRQSYRRSRY